MNFIDRLILPSSSAETNDKINNPSISEGTPLLGKERKSCKF